MIDDEGLFGHDMRHKPPLPQLLTSKGGWGGSHGRLALSEMVRTQDSNMSEYACNTIGMLPYHYIIVNEQEVDYDPDTALRVGHKRIAIPVKEFARQRRMNISDQWELMNPRWIGTYYGKLDDIYRHRHPRLDDARMEAAMRGKEEEFNREFYTLYDDHREFMQRMKRRLNRLLDLRMEQKSRVSSQKARIRQIKSDMAFQRLGKYGDNIFNVLTTENLLLDDFIKELDETNEKIDDLRRYLKQNTL